MQNYFFSLTTLTDRPVHMGKSLSAFTDNQLVWLYGETHEEYYVAELYLRYLVLFYGIALVRATPDKAHELARSFYPAMKESLKKEAAECDDFSAWIYLKVSQHLGNEKKSGITVDILPTVGILENMNIEEVEYLAGEVELTSLQRECLSGFFPQRLSLAEIAGRQSQSPGAVLDAVVSAIGKIAVNVKLIHAGEYEYV